MSASIVSGKTFPTGHAAREVRNALVRLFIAKFLKESNGIANFDRVPGILSELLNMPDKEILRTFGPKGVLSAGGARLYVGGAEMLVSPRSGELYLGVDWPPTSADTGDAPWSDVGTDWFFYVGAATACLHTITPPFEESYGGSVNGSSQLATKKRTEAQYPVL